MKLWRWSIGRIKNHWSISNGNGNFKTVTATGWNEASYSWCSYATKERALTCDREKDVTSSRTTVLSHLRQGWDMADRPAERTGRIEMFLETIRFLCYFVCEQHLPCGALSSADDGDEDWWAQGGHGSLAVLHRHHTLCGQGIKDELLWRVWLQSGSCSSVLSRCLDAWVEKEVSLWQKEGFTAGFPDKSQYNICLQGSEEHSRSRALGKAFPRKSPTGWCLLRADCVSTLPALVKARKLGLFWSCHCWEKSIKEVWSLNYRCLSAAGCIQVNSFNVLLHILNKPTCFKRSVHLHTVLSPSEKRTQWPLPKSHFHGWGEVTCFSAYPKR